MVNVVIFAFLERNGSVAPTSEFTVVNFKVVMFGQNAIGCGEFVIVFVATSFGKGAAMVFEACFGIWAANAETSDAYVWAANADEGAGFKGVAEDHATG